MLSSYFYLKVDKLIQHKDIPDAQLHEPKGIATAADKTVYVSNGLGTGAFRKITPNDLGNFTADLNLTNQKLVSDGDGNIVSVPDQIYGSMVVTDNNNGFAVSAASDASLRTNSDYVVFAGNGAPWTSDQLFNIEFDVNKLTITQSGIYRIDFWADLTGFPSNVAKIAVKYLINGTTFGTRKVQAKSNSVGDSGNLNGFGFLNLIEGDYVQLAIASSVAGTVTFESTNLALSLIRVL